MNRELPDVQAGFRKGRGTKDQIANIHWIIKEAKEFQKNIYFCFTNYTKAFDCGSQQTAENSSLYAGQEATVRCKHETMEWFKIGKGVHQGYILSPCLFNLYAEYIMWNAGLDEPQTGIKIARRNINNLSYADNISLMAEIEEELKSLLMKVKEESVKAGLSI